MAEAADVPTRSPSMDMVAAQGVPVFALEAMYQQDKLQQESSLHCDDGGVDAQGAQPPHSQPSRHDHAGRDTPPGRPLPRPADVGMYSASVENATSNALWAQPNSLESAAPINSTISLLPPECHDTVKKRGRGDATLSSPSKPTAPARPARPRAPSLATVVATAMTNPDVVVTDDAADSSSGIVTFDVGGTIFRCKQRVVEKYPNKRLHRLLLCGCEQQQSSPFASPVAAIFVDRNPNYFAVILDWYRTGTFHVPDSLSMAGLHHEAAYFDVLAEMFSNNEAPALPSASSPIKVAVSVPPISPSAPTPSRSPATGSSLTAIHCFVKSYTLTLLPAQPPVVFILRAHEQLVLESAAGVGRLLLRVTDLHGSTTVPRAVLYDSHSYFFLGGGQAKLHGTPFPGNLIYSFWADDTASGEPPETTAMPLHVEFKLRCAFHASEVLALTPDAQKLLSHTLDMVAKSTSATVTTAVLAGLEVDQPSPSPRGPDRRAADKPKQPPLAMVSVQPPTQQPSLAPGPTVSTTTTGGVVAANDKFSAIPVYRPPPAATLAVPPAIYGAPKENASSLPEKTKERAQILDEAQQFQTKVKEHAAWLQHYQREMQQSSAIPRDLPPSDTPSSPTKKTSAASMAPVATPRPVVKRK
ncbi:hypothetical protein H310_14227 [Aphanomyces invadans]|uniref:BTB domain-containing protein n=1 Tax=Aphanomyces invadans TaxID=157072 RepID=A0A024TCQ2_9STRA|nr:hypothetical protein H310_14227 [Aphanomyces invadans]ETV91132.1 hypothetical protein H310_14227 [Aphanomyces invadans]|eukprot:XP_008880259.1 hypothetical protein H310_14227 [Aphanomyces invadans]